MIRRFNRNVIAAAHDAVMAALSFMLAVYLRLGEDQLALASDYLKYGTALFTVIAVAVFVSMRLYRGLWRYASMRDLVAITKAVTLSILVFAVVMFAINRLEGVPRSVLFINWMLLLFMLGGPRFLYRAMKDRSLSWRMSLSETPKIPVLLIGANDNADRFIRDMARNSQAPYDIVAIADDDPKQKGRAIQHVPIYGGTDILSVIIRKLERKGRRPQKIILTDPAASGAEVRHLLALAEGFNIPLARLPKSGEVKSDVSDKRDVQPIAIEDLLGRPQNVLNREAMRRLVEGEAVLITGAGGTIGGELARQIARLKPSQLFLLDSSEYNLYSIDREIRGEHPELTIHPLLADVRDANHIAHIFETHKPALVFHAAAIKHVPLSEINIEEAILTNVFGTLTIAETCQMHNAKAMVMISTDKAVNPANIMGASKRLAETVCQGLSESKRGRTRYITVRFGNVLGSTGSVVPLFQEQLNKGGPLTVTHPDMTRYFMTTREAVELVLQAAAMGSAMPDRRECVFVLDMGQPVRILDLASQIIRLAGLIPGEDIQITFTGLRPGEKLHEELFYFSENAVKTAHESIYLASPHPADMNSVRASLEKLLSAARARKTPEVKSLLKLLVPEYASH